MTRKSKKDQLPDTDRREQILEVASKCIIKFGLQKTNAQVIANEMGISQTTIFYYFPKQQMLFEALFDHIVTTGRTLAAKVFSTVRHTLTHREKLLMYIKGQLMWGEAYPHHTGVLMFSVLETGHSADLKIKVEGALNHGEETIFSILAGGIVEKEFPALAEPRLVAMMIHKALIGSMMDLYLRAGVKKAADYERALVHYVMTLLEMSAIPK